MHTQSHNTHFTRTSMEGHIRVVFYYTKVVSVTMQSRTQKLATRWGFTAETEVLSKLLEGLEE